MISQLTRLGVQVPAGFATTADAFREFLAHEGSGGTASRIRLASLNVPTTSRSWPGSAVEIRGWVLGNPFPAPLERAMVAAWEKLGGERNAVAVRSSATAEDLPDASFAGQQETFLNVRGKRRPASRPRTRCLPRCSTIARSPTAPPGIRALAGGAVGGCAADGTQRRRRQRCYVHAGYRVRFRDVVFITASYGLGESVVQGAVNPDEFYVYKPALRAGKTLAIVRRQLGSKTTKMIYDENAGSGKRVQTVPVPAGERAALLPERCR
jgi:pyruvate,water dikinase